MKQEKYDQAAKGGRGKTILIVLAIILGAALVAALIIIIALAAVLGVERSNDSEAAATASRVECTTPVCIELSNQVLSYMDESVDPCHDFYAFSCNGFVEDAIIPFGAGGVSTFGDPRRLNIERIRVLMESRNNRGSDAVAKAITYYTSCLAGDSLDVSVEAFQQVVQGLGGWPLIGMDLSTTWSLNNMEGLLTEKLYGSQALFNIMVIPSSRNSTENSWTVLSGGLTIPGPPAYQVPFILDLIKDIMMSAFTLINPSISNETYSAAADDIIDFEIKLANVTTFDGNFINSLIENSNFMTYSQLQSIFPQFNWETNFEYYARRANIPQDSSRAINVLDPEYLSSLSTLIAETDNETLENYSKWHLLLALMPSMSEEFADLAFRFRNLVRPDIRIQRRYVRCINFVENQLHLAISRAFTEEYILPEVRGNLSSITSELEIALRERINSRDWLDEPTRQRALNKLRSIHELVAYPDIVLNDGFLNSYYSSLNVSAGEPFLLNQVSTSAFNSLANVRELNVANNRSLWYLPIAPPTLTNAAYISLINQIYIFEGILEPPIFDTRWPDYFKYGTVGFVVGHEYTHGFDNRGRRFNEVGNLENWWSNSSETQFQSRAQCYIDQYNGYSLPTGPINGTRTLGENIADNGGLTAAFRAYKNYLRKTGKVEPTLPGLSYTPDQLFFIANAQIWCHTTTPLTERFLVNSGVHSPNSIRPLGTHSNSVEFAAAFNCNATARMNPAEKCELW